MSAKFFASVAATASRLRSPALAAALLALPLSSALATAALAQSKPTLSVVAGITMVEGAPASNHACTVLEKSRMTLSSPVTVNLRISQTGDFLAPGETGDKTFVAMSTTNFYDHYLFTVDNDAVDELDGTVTCTLLPGDGYEIDGALGSHTQPIRDDDPTIVTLARVGGGAVSEGGSVEFTVTLSRELAAGEIIDAPLDVLGGRPTRGDWRLFKKNRRGFNTSVRLRPESHQIVSFDGEGARAANLVLMPLHDAETEGTVTYTVALESDATFDRGIFRTNVGGGADPHASQNSFSVPVNDVAAQTRCTHTTNHPLPGCVWITGGSAVREGGNVTFTVHADPPPPDDLDVTFAVFDARDLSDYLRGRDEGRVTLTIPKGQTSATHTISTMDDNTNEEHGEVQAEMRYKRLHPGGPDRKIPNEADFYYGTRDPRMAWVTVRDNDPPPLPFVPPKISMKVLPVSGSVAKGAWATFCTTVDDFFEHTPRNHEIGRFHVHVEARTSAGVYVRSSAQHFNTGDTERFCSRIDTAPWAGQTLIARVLPAPYQVVFHSRRVTPYVLGASPTATLTVGASPAGVSFANGSRLVAERFKGTVNLNVDIVPAASSPFTLNFALEGTATPGADYAIPGVTGSSGTVAVPAGAARVKIPVTMIDDTIEDDGETIIVRLQPSGAYQPAAPDSVTVTIRNEDPDPMVTVAAGSAVTEGGDAVFTVTATPAPEADLPVSVTVATDGDWGVAAGGRTVTIPASGSATLTLATTGDDADEPDGSLTVTVAAGDGYAAGDPASGTVAVRDDDEAAPGGEGAEPDWTDYRTVVDYLIGVRDNPENEDVRGNPAHIRKWNRVLEAIGHDTGTGLSPMPASEIHANADKWPDSPFRAASAYLNSVDAQDGQDRQDQDQPQQQTPEIAVTAGDAVTEGGDAAFTLTAAPAPAADLAVSVTVGTDGDWGVAAGGRTVTIPASGSATLTLATTGDDADEADGSVTVTVAAGDGYAAGDPASGTVAVRDDDEAAPGGEGAEPDWTDYRTVVDYLIGVRDNPENEDVRGNPAHIRKWNRVLEAIGHDTGTGLSPMPASEIHANADKWPDSPFRAASAYLNSVDAQDGQDRQDQDQPQQQTPEIAVTAGDAVTEGGDAAFTLTAAPAPAADLAVSVTVGTDGDWGVAAGGRTVTIPTSGSATLTLATTGDDADEADGSVTVTVADGGGYTVGSSASGTVAVRDDDEPPAEVTVSVDDAEVTESGDGDSVLMTFTARLSGPAPGTVTVRAATRDSSPMSAAAREDYWPFDGKAVRFRPGQVRQSIHVLVYDDSHDEGGETFELALSDAEGAAIGDGVAVGTIVNGDPMPAAWLARFGRAVADRALDGIAARVESRGESARAPGFRGVFAGVSIGGGAGLGAADRFGLPAGGAAFAPRAGGFGGGAAEPFAAGASGSGHFGGGRFGESPTGPANGGAFAPRAGGFGGGAPAAVGGAARGGLAQLLLGSRFTHTGGEDASGGVLGFWGRGSRTRFDGADGDLDLDGGVTTAMLGADYARGDWLAGVALAQSSGDGGYRGPAPAGDVLAGDVPAGGGAGAGSATDGRLEASLTAAVPYAAWRPSERLAVWGAAGYGAGDLALAPDGAGSVSADIGWRMAAAGLKGELFSFAGGATLSLVSDALWASTGSDRANGLVATGSAVSRLRLGVEGGRRLALPGGGSLTPKLEIGARHDGGDAEAGFGVEVGGGIAWSAPGLGLRLDLGGRTLLTHDDGAMRDRGFSASLAWDPRPDSARGLSLALRQDVGGPSGGGLDALFADDAFAGRRPGHVGRVGRVPARRTAEMGYGLAAFGGRFTGAPHLSYGTSHGAREIGLGWRLSPEAAAGAPDLGVAVLATRRESLRDEPAERRIGIEARARW